MCRGGFANPPYGKFSPQNHCLELTLTQFHFVQNELLGLFFLVTALCNRGFDLIDFARIEVVDQVLDLLAQRDFGSKRGSLGGIGLLLL